jgi:CMP-N,N'-diacetyllegionaminic acid synthase
MVITEFKVIKYNIIGVIHARGGSKRIPLKNIKLLNGVPLIEYSIKAGLNSKYIRRLVVSTDHQEIRKIALTAGAEVPFVRPKELSTDCPSEWVSQHAVTFIEEEEGKKVDIVVSMQPTTPFIESQDIDECIELLIKNKKLTSSFTSAPITERPEAMYYYNGNTKLKKYYKDKIPGGDSQLLPKIVFPNGGAFVTRRDILFDRSELMTEHSGTCVMPFERSIDIDNPIDFEFAEFVINKNKN